MAARNFLPRCIAFELQIFNDSIGIRLKNAVHLGKKFLAAIFSAILYYIQVETKDMIPCAAREKSTSYHYVATSRTKQFHALLRAIHAFEISIHITLRQVMFLKEFHVNVKGVYSRNTVNQWWKQTTKTQHTKFFRR